MVCYVIYLSNLFSWLSSCCANALSSPSSSSSSNDVPNTWREGKERGERRKGGGGEGERERERERERGTQKQENIIKNDNTHVILYDSMLSSILHVIVVMLNLLQPLQI